MTPSHRSTLIFVLAATALAGASVIALAAAGGAFDRGFRSSVRSTTCAVPLLPGTVVDASLINMGGPMMGRPGNPPRGGMMRLTLGRNTVPAGQVSFLAVNGGSVSHELVVLPLPADQIVGTRTVGPDAKVDETGSLGEASSTCGQGSGEGIAPGASSWVTITLAAGHYELACNLPGHYAAGMYAQLVVT